MAPSERENKSDNEIRYRGVNKRPSGKYGARIKDSNKKKTVWLGTFNSAVEAAKAYDAAAIELCGADKAKTNFPILNNVNINNNNNAVVQTLNSSTTTAANSLPHVPSPNHAACLASHHSDSSSALIVEAGKKFVVNVDLNPSPPCEILESGIMFYHFI